MTADDLPGLIVRLRQLRPALADEESTFQALELTIAMAERTEAYHPEASRVMCARALASMLDGPPAQLTKRLLECAIVGSMLLTSPGATP